MTAVDDSRKPTAAINFRHPQPRLRWCLIAIVYASVCLCWKIPPIWAAEPVEGVVAINLLELPSSRQAQRSLQSDAHFYWEQTPLRSGLRELSQTHHISVWLDRQLDPTQLVTTHAIADGQSSLQARLRQLSTVVNAEMGLIENVVYIGPPGRVGALQRAAVELHDAISRGSQQRVAQLRPWRWDELSNSAEMLAQLSAEWHMAVAGELPHDLYHAGELVEPSTLATQLTLLAGGFEMEAEMAGPNRFQLKRLDQRSVWQANYRKSDLDLRGLVRWRQTYVGSQCQTRGQISSVQGVTDFHLALLVPPATGVEIGSRDDSARWDFEVLNKKVNSVLDMLAGSMGFTVQWDAGCTAEMRSQLISFQVAGATTDELFAAVARASGLKIIRDKNQLRVKP